MAKSAEDISKALLIAQKYKSDIAVRGGGHSPSGSSSSEGGVVIDLSQMRQVTVDVESKSATCQGGALWEDVDLALGKHGLAAVGGTVNHTGIGGLTLGGGYGWLSGQYGLVVDNLLSVKLVLANGRIVTASEAEEPDLLWALKGAGQNFGVAVEFTYRAYETAHKVYSGSMIFTPDKLEGIVNFANTLGGVSDKNSGLIFTFVRPPGAPTPLIAVTIFYDGAETDGKRKFAPLLDLESIQNTVGMIPYTEVNSLMNRGAAHGGQKSFHGGSFSLPLNPTFAKKILDEYVQTLDQTPELSNTAILWEYFNLQTVCEVPKTATAFANRALHQNVLVLLRYEDQSRQKELRARGQYIQNFFQEEFQRSQGGSASDVPLYANYVDGALYFSRGDFPLRIQNYYLLLNDADESLEAGDEPASKADSKLRKLFGPNLEKLQKLKGVYDPTNVFNKMHAITPAFESLMGI